MKTNTPSSHFEEKEADRLIANFGVKPSPEKQQEIQKSLAEQKEKFMAHEREREARTGHERDRSA